MDAIKDMKGLELSIYGNILPDGYMSKKKLERIVEYYDSNYEHIHYYGSVNKNDVNKVLRNHDVFVLPTFFTSEAFPISVLEAIDNNCFVILAKSARLTEIFDEFHISWVEPQSTASIQSALQNTDFKESDLIKNRQLLKSKYTSFQRDEIIERIFNRPL